MLVWEPSPSNGASEIIDALSYACSNLHGRVLIQRQPLPPPCGRYNQLKYGRICAYFLSPIPFTFFKSSALLNGRAAIIRAAITGPTPGIILSSFSVAVLMSNLAGNNLSFLLVLGDEAAGGAGDAVGALDRSIFAAHPPSLACFA
jgi:hypothetical protein